MKTAKQILPYLKPYIYFSQLIGCFPYYIKSDDFKISLKLSPFQILFSFILITPMAIYGCFFYSPPNGWSIMEYIDTVNYIILNFCVIVSVSSYYCRYRKVIEVCEKFLFYARFVKDTNFLFKILLLTLTDTVLCLLWNISMFIHYMFLYSFLDCFCNAYLMIVSHLVSHQFVFFLLYFFKVFQWINHELITKLRNTSWISHEAFEFASMEHLKSDCFEMCRIIEAYEEIGRFCDEVNEIFGLTIASTIFYSFMSLIEWANTFLNEGLTLIFPIAFGYYSTHIWIILYSCEITKEEVKGNCRDFTFFLVLICNFYLG